MSGWRGLRMVNGLIARSDANFQGAGLPGGKHTCAEIELDGEDAVGHWHVFPHERRADSCAACGVERELEIIRAVGGRAAVGQAALISERCGLRYNCAGAGDEQQE